MNPKRLNIILFCIVVVMFLCIVYQRANPVIKTQHHVEYIYLIYDPSEPESPPVETRVI